MTVIYEHLLYSLTRFPGKCTLVDVQYQKAATNTQGRPNVREGAESRQIKNNNITYMQLYTKKMERIVKNAF